MAKVHKRTQEISHFILENVDLHSKDIAAFTANHFDMTRQGVNRHIKRLVEEKLLTTIGATRDKYYFPAVLNEWKKVYVVDDSLSEGDVWNEDIAPFFDGLPENVHYIWHYGFTEMFNNVIDHANATKVIVQVKKTAVSSIVTILDDGEGIFKKIQKSLNLSDERHAVLELAKGKFTTDPDNHSGEGIFFSSRGFDEFRILSGLVYFLHSRNLADDEDWIRSNNKEASGTTVVMEIKNNASQDMEVIFNDFASGEDYGFTQTVVPVELAEYGDSRLVSRSQAKRVLVRIDRFKAVIFDFEGVDLIGQAFADEIFRVFQKEHPEIELSYFNANKKVENMIKRALSGMEK